ncbi:MAG: LPXTG cell wall anchor domain-containing protein [Lactobacillus sp.]|nr:LPXTG cell wall anchor domain-containing protein [Lactobacillus sp.]
MTVATAQPANENVSSTVFMTNEPVSSENKPATHHHTDSQSDSNQQKLPQTGNENTVLLGLGLSALAAMLGIGGRRLKKIKIITDWA